MTDEEFYRHALEVLQRELGTDGLTRFSHLNRSVGGDYTRDREKWLNRALAGRCASVAFGEVTQ